ncbi:MULTISPECIES: DUF4087 domain-containing protein [Vibrio]|uniref:DUF4087 domain-containing protein n=2 Tax=Vibrio TaxID=662 RepID=F9RZ31_9VIBR|nr:MULTISPECIES: DUF4087 domain-containing protein [Vibrio]EGU29112.1 hypothetical protein VIS19158_20361 [Vibrio scophthalmi LMG 19158]EGU46107.1 hypothetical protein VII00023_09571 [Vibrio ichthyoenteri ATCC 700023]
MKFKFMLCALLLPLSLHAAENRCGWVLNPTPHNVWLHDRDGTWTISMMGDYLEETPSLYRFSEAFADESQVVRNNGVYGYACACMKVDVDKERERITKIYQVNQLSLKRCQDDRAIADYVLD